MQVGGENARYRTRREHLAKRTLACAKGEEYVATEYKVCFDTRGRPGLYDRDVMGSHIFIQTSRLSRLTTGQSGDGRGRGK